MKHIILVEGLIWTAKSYEHDQTKFELCNDKPNMETWKNNKTRLFPGAIIPRSIAVIKDIIHSDADMEKASVQNAKQEKAKRDKIHLARFNTVIPQTFTLPILKHQPRA